MWPEGVSDTADLQEILFFQVLLIKSQLHLLSNSYSYGQHDIVSSGQKAMWDDSSGAFVLMYIVTVATLQDVGPLRIA
jgi:hypothetical protein